MTSNRIKPLYFLFLLSVFFLGIGFTGCDEEIFTTNPKNVLSFSTDTVAFDTVFTSIGSTTSKFVVYNRSNKAIRISSVKLAGGASSNFRINVDGTLNSKNEFSDIEISAKDSMFVFVQVTVNPKNSDSPVFIEDSLKFITNGVAQQVKLQAFGQDVVIMKNKMILNDTTLSSDRPYLIYGYMAVDTAKTLTIPPGCKLYFHNNANLYVYGNLVAEGTPDQPIAMRGDRLDKIKFVTPIPYDYVAGQWGGVYLLWSGAKHILKNVNINSGYVGLYFSNDDRTKLPSLDVENCRIQNFVYYGIVAQNGNLRVINSEVSNTGGYTVYLSGGKHEFIQSTIANYYSNNVAEPSSRDKNPAVMIMNLYKSAPMNTVFQNCIITGTLANEFALASRYMTQYNGTFSHCYIRRADTLSLAQFSHIRWWNSKDSVFKHSSYNYEKGIYFNFTPDSISPVRGLADPSVISQYHLEYDLNGNRRDDKPDAGAYEWQPTK